MKEKIIYHITSLVEWEQALEAGVYTADSLASEGFIHASTSEQVQGTANYLFVGKHGLVVLEIDAERVPVEIKYELAPNGLTFPHIYGPLNIDAVLRVVDFLPGDDGFFTWPSNLEG